jgi:hypothetical protein
MPSYTAGDMTVMHCRDCGIEFWVPTFWNKLRVAQGGEYVCPNGHRWVYRESELVKTTRERDRLKQQMAHMEDQLRAQKAQTTKAKKVAEKLKVRASAGVCPCCNRTFNNMARHMRTKHPDFKTADIIPLKEEKAS